MVLTDHLLTVEPSGCARREGRATATAKAGARIFREDRRDEEDAGRPRQDLRQHFSSTNEASPQTDKMYRVTPVA